MQHLGPPTESYEVVTSMYARRGKKSLQIVLKTIRIQQKEEGPLFLLLSRTWAHNLSARMGLEVRGAMMNTPQQKDIPNV